MTAHPRDAADPTFVDDAKLGRHYEARTAAWLTYHGLASVWMPPLSIRPSGADPAAYSDHGDLEVRLLPCSDPGDHRIVEVKYRESVDFTCAADFPFPTICVDWQHKVDAWEDPPVAVFAWCRALTHFALIHPEATRETWSIEHFTNRAGRRAPAYVCPVEKVTSWKVDDTPLEVRKEWLARAFAKGVSSQ